MKHHFFRKIIICNLLLLFHNAIQSTTTYFNPRSQSIDSARELVGISSYLFDTEPTIQHIFAATAEYAHSIKENNIAEYFFGDALLHGNCPTLHISGSDAGGRMPTDWLADYFGLPIDFRGTVTMHPSITNYIVDFFWYTQFCGDWKQWYIRAHAPLVHTSWNLGLSEMSSEPGISSYTAGYFAPTAVPASTLLHSFLEYMDGSEAAIVGTTIFEPLAYSRMSTDSKTKTRLSDIQVIGGYNFFQEDTYHLGLFAELNIPTGNRPEAIWLFEPIIGNGHHVGLGGGITGHIQVDYQEADYWCADHYPKVLDLWAEIHLVHLFSASQWRSFDLYRQGANSRYMLATQLNTPVTNNLQGGPTIGDLTPAPLQFKNRVASVANITTLPVKVSCSYQLDATVLLSYEHKQWNYQIAYNIWARGCESICVRQDCNPRILQETWALKGDAFLFGFDPNNGLAPVALSATQSHATIFSGKNFAGTLDDPTNMASAQANPGIDNPQFAFGDATNGSANNELREPSNIFNTRTSIDPVLITPDDIYFGSATTTNLTQSIVAHISHSWLHHACTTPFLGVGGKVELAFASSDCKTSCSRCALSQVALWIKTGVTF